MKLIVDKLGRIDHAEIEIKPLTVFVGENNTNKTWAAYCLYGLARHLSWTWSDPTGHEFGHGILPVRGDAKDAIDEAARRASSDIPSEVDTYGLVVSRHEIIGPPTSPMEFIADTKLVREVLRLPNDVAFDGRASLRVEPAEFVAGEWEARITRSTSTRLVTTQFGAGHKAHSFAWRPSGGDTPQAMNDHIVDLIRAFGYRFMGPGTILALPSERKALVTLYKTLRTESDRMLPQPVVEFIDFLKTCENVAQHRDDLYFDDAVGYLEASILGGSIRFESAAAGTRLTYVPKTGEALPMHTTSSMVRALAGLDVYLRYWAQPGDLLIIDEPEMNAHPDAQLRITELLAYLVHKGVRVVLTTHSPYVLDHLATLVEASRLGGDARAGIVQKLRLKNDEALLEPEQLAVYRFDLDGNVTSIFDPETRSIDPSTFSDVGDAETNLFSDVLAAGRRGD